MHRAAVIVNDVLAASGLFVEIFRYDVGEKGKHLLENICSISMVKSFRIGL
jgi:hypothetical protein